MLDKDKTQDIDFKKVLRLVVSNMNTLQQGPEETTTTVLSYQSNV